MKQLSIIFLLILSSCMINDDWHTHNLELNTIDNILLIDGVDSGDITYKISPDNIGITFYINEDIDYFTWHFNVLNKEGVCYGTEITDGEIYVAHNFNEHQQDIFKATTYLMESHLHFIINLN